MSKISDKNLFFENNKLYTVVGHHNNHTTEIIENIKKITNKDNVVFYTINFYGRDRINKNESLPVIFENWDKVGNYSVFYEKYMRD